jgi:peptidoglycan/LPS O-acetylase OafA/YrhL
MLSLAQLLLTDIEVMRDSGMWVFLSIGAVALFVVFIPLVTWIDGRRKEREAFYKAETFRRLTESSAEGAKAALEMLREQERQQIVKSREGMKISGLVCIGVGVALIFFLYAKNNSSYLVGLIPALVGVANLVYVLFLAAPVDQPKG